ncbi:MAG: ABC transporter substrate-binding protein, partial [Cyanobacteria bacterium P01_F01_bin.143]
ELTIDNAIKQGANSLLVVPHIDRIHEAVELAKINHNRNSNEKLQLFSSPSLYTFKTLEDEEGRDAVKGMQMAVYWHPGVNIRHYFSNDARLLWRKDLDYTIATWRTAMAYDATQAIIKGLKQNPTRKGLQKVLSDKDNFFFNGATGEVGFENGERKQKPAFFVEIKQVENSETNFDFVPIP